MFDGYRRVAVGAFQDMSPMSSEPPPRLSSSFTGNSSGASSPFSPFSDAFTSCWTAFASRWSISLHEGSPTFLMLSYMTSDTGLLKWAGQAEPRIRQLTLVPVIMAAACAIVFPVSNISFIRGYSVSRKKYQTDARGGTTLGWSPPLVM